MSLSDLLTIVPEWPAAPGVRALCTTRAGGVSAGPYRSLNLGDHVGDDPAAVTENRRRLSEALGARAVFMRQVHGQRVALLDERTLDGIEADACVASTPGLACTIMVADCLPLLFASGDGRTVGAAHAGWRGLAGGVIEAAVGAMTQAPQGPQAADLLVWLGPCIGPANFEVGEEVKTAFEQHDGAAAAHFRAASAGKWLADLQGLARQRLQAQGITRIFGNDGSTPWCTVADPSRFFSHRRDRVSGRLAAAICIDG
ncbi:peptidoglycan editing factor PgeF [Ramlibacter solisilvae]|uniref:Purine nucleoside phosphorylase n=1 Tax=Ramlibacter tataouinensis TaxID=94132 RepID=A0A127K147_9BURK|nr:peptidoglycan editing factor PgeF [Ramlibacter tataouinensis]AMO24832.1 laccase [Ramlibacter tataouinensis]